MYTYILVTEEFLIANELQDGDESDLYDSLCDYLEQYGIKHAVKVEDNEIKEIIEELKQSLTSNIKQNKDDSYTFTVTKKEAKAKLNKKIEDILKQAENFSKNKNFENFISLKNKLNDDRFLFLFDFYDKDLEELLFEVVEGNPITFTVKTIYETVE
ncbi:MAG: hypothetical protein QW735_04505 [archaeon]